VEAVKLFEMAEKKVCRLCKNDHNQHGKFTRKKVVKNYKAVEQQQKERWIKDRKARGEK